MEIRDAQGNIILSETYDGDHPDRYFVVADSSYRFQEIMGDNNIVLNFSLTYYVEFPIGSTINFQNTVYTMLSTAHFTKQNERQYDYTITFESAQKELSRYKFRNMVDGRLNFTLTAQPQEFLEHIVWNINDREGGNRWQVGEVVVSAEKTQSFSQNYLLDALNQVAQLFETEWEIVGTTINLRKVEYNKTETKKNRLEYGRGNGFISGISRQNSGENAVDVLWVEGGDRNIDSQTYTYMKAGQMLHANKLRLPKNVDCYYVPPTDPMKKGILYTSVELRKMAHDAADMDFDAYVRWLLYKDGKPTYVLYHTDADGFGIFRYDYINGGYEDSIDFSEIYPKKVLYVKEAVLEGFETGYMSDVTDKDKEKMKLRFWDLKAKTADGSAIPDYNECLIGGQDVTIVFNTGMLAGKEFNLGEIQLGGGKVGCYNPDRNSFQFLVQPQEIDGITMPDMPTLDKSDPPVPVTDGDKTGTGYVPRGEERDPYTDEITYIGDEFAVFHVSLPQQYIDEAEKELLLEGCHYLWQHSEVEVEFSGTVDPIWSVNKWSAISQYFVLGGYINFYDNDFCRDGKQLRILSIKTYLNNPHAPELTLSNSSVSQSISSELKKIPQNQVYTDYRVDNITSYARRSFRDAEETRDALGKWAEETNNYFTSGISPATVQTMQLLVGDKSLQFEFGKVTTNASGIVTAFDKQPWSPYWTDDGKLVCPLVFSDGVHVIMRHRYYTTESGNEGVVKEFTDAEFPYWQFASNTQHEFTPPNPQYPYYLYIKAPKSAVTDHIGKVVDYDYAEFELREINENAELPTDTTTHYYLLAGILNSERNGTRSYTNVYGTVEITGGQIRLDQAISIDGDNYIDFINMIFKGDVNIVDGGVAREFIFGTSKANNYGGITGANVYYGEYDEDFYGRAVRMWIGNDASLRTVGGRQYLYGARIAFFADGSFLFKYGGKNFFRDVNKFYSLQTEGAMKVDDEILANEIYSNKIVKLGDNGEFNDVDTTYLNGKFAHFVGNIEGVKTVGGAYRRKYKGLVPTLVFSGIIHLNIKNPNQGSDWGAGYYYRNWGRTFYSVPYTDYYSAKKDSGADMQLYVGSPSEGVALCALDGWNSDITRHNAVVVCNVLNNNYYRVYWKGDPNRPTYERENIHNWSFAVEVFDNRWHDDPFGIQIYIFMDN